MPSDLLVNTPVFLGNTDCFCPRVHTCVWPCSRHVPGYEMTQTLESWGFTWGLCEITYRWTWGFWKTHLKFLIKNTLSFYSFIFLPSTLLCITAFFSFNSWPLTSFPLIVIIYIISGLTVWWWIQIGSPFLAKIISPPSGVFRLLIVICLGLGSCKKFPFYVSWCHLYSSLV